MSDEDKKFSELDADERQQNLDYIRGRWSQYYNVSRETKKDVVKYIAFVNAGGAATTLAFLGAIADKPESYVALRFAVGAFVVGIIFSGLVHVAESLRLSGLFKDWRTSVSTYYADKIGFAKMHSEDAERAETPNFAVFLVGLAGLCFLVGSVIATWQLVSS